MVGTLSLREENEVHLVKYSASTGDVTCEGLYAHQHEIWDLASCPFDPLIFSTVHASAGDFGASVWRLPDHSKRSSQLEKLADLNGHTKKIKCTLWSQSGREHPQLLSIDEEALHVWDIDVSGRSVQVDKKISPGVLYHMRSGAWDPHDPMSVATVSDSCVQFWDLRSTKQAQALENAHAHDLDFNPQKQHIFATVGDESQILLWDKRNLGYFLLELPGHSHWTWRVRYNPKCDEFLLSSGTDSLVNLWTVDASHEDNAGARSPEDSPRAHIDPLLRSYNGHEDSVYGIAWSLKEPWIFASLSYDGRVLVDSVPQHVAKHIKLVTQ
ncbi:hypothetical protein GOP47_0015869 [Adiantum capillus-veneris]|uniref:EIPR1-like beta-propeller domain-containing protein n=1 Tax=Adiantum capillus-veneris TaxID=13818 RepID=A0A9D4UKG2_ADICA|nr:hypothetical protein GOP47_0015869 [Adiantum capillus-veneris]